MAVVTTNLELWYDSTNSASNTGSGTTLYDLSGNARNGTINNPVRVDNYFELENTTTNKSIDTGNTFNSFMSGSSCQFSIEMWMWVNTAASTNTNRYRTFFMSDLGLNGGGFSGASERPTASGGNQTNFGWYFFSPYYQWTNNTINSGAWVQYVFVCDGANKYIYQNGSLTHSATTGSSIAAATNNFGFFGPVEGYYGYDGKFAIARVYSKVLTSGEILQNYNTDRFNVNLIENFDFSNTNTYSGSGNTVYDISYYQDNASIVGAAITGSGQSKSFLFTDLNDTIFSGTGLSPNLSYSSWTENIWFKVGLGNTDSTIASFGNSSTNISRLIVSNSSINSGRLSFANRLATDTIDFGINPLTDRWYNVQLVSTGSSVMGYLDGVYKGGTSLVEQIGNPRTLTLSGNNAGTVAPSSGFFNGNIAIFQAYNTNIGATGVSYIYDDQKSRFPNPPVKFAEYDLSDVSSYPGTGNTVYDLSGNNNNFQLNGPTFSGTGQSKYLQFDGVNDYASGFGFTGLSSSTVFSRNLWIQLDSNTQDQWITSLGAYGPPEYCVSEDFYDGTVSLQWEPNYGANVSQINAGSLGTGTWLNLAYVAAGSSAIAYVNGVQVGTVTGVTKTLDTNTLAFCISGYIDKYNPTPAFNFGNPFSGRLAYLEYFDGYLSGSAISTLYNDMAPRFLNLTPPPPGPYQGLVGGRTFGQGFAG